MRLKGGCAESVRVGSGWGGCGFALKQFAKLTVWACLMPMRTLCLILFLSSILLAGGSDGFLLFKEEGELVDGVHGYSLTLPPGYRVRVGSYGLLISDMEVFLLLRGTPMKSPREVASLILQEARWLSGGRGSYHFKPMKGGLLLYTGGLSYPLFIADLVQTIPPNAYQDGFLSSLVYEGVHLLLPGERSVLSVSVYIPQEASEETRRRVLEVLRSMKFFPPSSSKPVDLQDPLLGLAAYTALVPEPYRLRWDVVKMSAHVRDVAYVFEGQGVTLRKDHVVLSAHLLQTPFGGDAQSLLTINNRTYQFQGFVCPTSERDVVSFLLSLWGQESGKTWELKLAKPWKEKGRIAEHIRNLLEIYMSPPMGLPFNQYKSTLFIQAQSGDSVREARVFTYMVYGSQGGYMNASGQCNGQIEVLTLEGSRSAILSSVPAITGFLLSLKQNKDWAWKETLRARRESAEQTRMVLEMSRESEEYNSWISRSWTNLLSDQTYVRDPSTGEVFKTYKASFDTGSFWREPVFGGILGSVERGGKIEELLRENGWRQLEQSLSGLPGTWQR